MDQENDPQRDQEKAPKIILTTEERDIYSTIVTTGNNGAFYKVIQNGTAKHMEKFEVWEEVRKIFNSHTGRNLTRNQIRGIWNKKKKAAKASHDRKVLNRKINVACNKTGGGPSPEFPQDFDGDNSFFDHDLNPTATPFNKLAKPAPKKVNSTEEIPMLNMDGTPLLDESWNKIPISEYSPSEELDKLERALQEKPRSQSSAPGTKAFTHPTMTSPVSLDQTTETKESLGSKITGKVITSTPLSTLQTHKKNGVTQVSGINDSQFLTNPAEKSFGKENRVPPSENLFAGKSSLAGVVGQMFSHDRTNLKSNTLTTFFGSFKCPHCDREEESLSCEGLTTNPYCPTLSLPQQTGDEAINVHELMQQFLQKPFQTRCPTCRAIVLDAKIKPKVGNITIISLNRLTSDRKNMVNVVTNPISDNIVDKIFKETLATVNHIGINPTDGGHFVAYSKIGNKWSRNDDNKRIVFPSHNPFQLNSSFAETVNIIFYKCQT